ncbi:MucR family transcriptional regulator [Methylorubrum salsuginis]|uniref:Transcriptional regulator, MucR family n=1 Tax=Methylorubrum salsuginis TaxID=414703 RepID=A0A1I4FKY5_9HYPH|nr:MucR family transcriptional regulator [Methylorubrum salsuginis]SFL18109.1 transcriptional regulator, MucR family [Methylorubrum salsuginis]
MADDDKPFPILEAYAVFDPTLGYTADIVSAYLGKNPTAIDQLPKLILSVSSALKASVAVDVPAGDGGAAQAEKPSEAQISASITPDALISFLDGKPYKTIRRHLTTHGLTPEGYRARFGLPVDYPMVSPNYSAARSELAKAAGLGRGGAAPEAPEAGPSAGDAAPVDESIAA